MSNVEQLLTAIINGDDISNYECHSRIEEYLKNICLGESCENMTPKSRIEYLLKVLSENGTSKVLLNAPEIEIKNAVLTILDKYNGNFVDNYDILFNGESVLKTADKEVDLSNLIVDSGEYDVSVKALGENFKDSETSNIVDYEAQSLTPFSSFTISGDTISDYTGTETVINIPGQYSYGDPEIKTVIPTNFSALNQEISYGTIPFPCTVGGIYLENRSAFYTNRTAIMALFNQGEVVVTYEVPYLINGDDYQITTIAKDAFKDLGRSDITDIIIPSNIKTIGGAAFCQTLSNRNLIARVTFIGKSSLETINYDAFDYCYSLREINFPKSLKTIGRSVFSSCTNLTTVTFEEGSKLETIDAGAFSVCEKLANIEIPEGVKSIGESAFNRCALSNVTIPSSVTSIHSQAFTSNPTLTSIIVMSENKIYDSRNNCNAIIKTATNELVLGCSNTLIPNSVTRIGDYSFHGCDNLTKITIPDSVTSIGEYAIYYCDNLSEVIMGNGVTTIGDSAFQGNANLTNIKLPDSLISMGTRVFAYSGLTNISIPDNVTSIGAYAFSNCESLTDIKFPNGILNIPQAMFYYCKSLTDINIPDSVNKIELQAFQYCSSLVKVDFSSHTAIPTLQSTSAFSGVNASCKIIVPDDLYDQWIVATNWSAVSSYIIKASEVTV